MKRDGVRRGCASPSLIGCAIMMYAPFQVDEVSESLELGHTLPHWPDGSQGAARGTLTSQGRNQELTDIQNLLRMLSTSRERASTFKLQGLACVDPGTILNPETLRAEQRPKKHARCANQGRPRTLSRGSGEAESRMKAQILPNSAVLSLI